MRIQHGRLFPMKPPDTWEDLPSSLPATGKVTTLALKSYHSFMKERYNIGLSLKKCRVTRSHVQRKRLYGTTKIFKLITKRSSSVLALIKEFPL